MVTLHGYVLRELLKTFLLALIALTGVVTMCGGVFNVVRLEGLTGADFFRFLPLVIPVAATITMPMAALYAATMVYGRLAADNELVACRAAGINVHRLFVAPVLLSIFVAVITAVCINYLIPDLSARIERAARTNLREFAARQLSGRGYLRWQERYLLTAERVSGVSDDALRERGLPTNSDYLLISAPTLLQLDGKGVLERFTAARWGLCRFDTQKTPVKLTVYLNHARDYEVGRQAVYLEQQTIEAEVPDQAVGLRQRASLADLNTLLAWREQPWDIPRVSERLPGVLRRIRWHSFTDWAVEQARQGEMLALRDFAGNPVEFAAAGAEVADGRAIFADVIVRWYDPRWDRPRVFEAPQAHFNADRSARDEMALQIRLIETLDKPVLEHDPRSVDYETGQTRDALTLDGLRPPAAVEPHLARITPASVLAGDVELPKDESVLAAYEKLRHEAGRQQRKVASTINFRFGFSASALVTIFMGAALGVIFRGSRALAAFALACIPFGTVVIMLFMGNRLGSREGNEMIGLAITWGGLLSVALMNFVILRVGVRR